jgi:hypothetical protein
MTREIAPETWSEYFEWLSKELPGAPVSISTVAPAGPSGVEARDLALLTLTYDLRDDVFEVAATRGGRNLASTVRHMVDHPEHVYVDRDVMLAPITIEDDARDGSRTVITIEDEPELSD